MVAEAYLARLGERGIEYVFANAGTDFAPIVDNRSRATPARPSSRNSSPCRTRTSPWRGRMAYYRTSGKLAAVMVHVTVGTANAVCGIMNAARDGVPVLLAAGRTPLTETGHVARRNRSDPLGAGGVRPGRHGARILQMGLRAAPPASPSTRWSTGRSTLP